MSVQTVELPLILPTGPECERCMRRLSDGLHTLKGVARAAVDSARITVEFDPDIVTVSRIEQEAQRVGADIAATIDHQSLELRDLDCPDCAASIEKDVGRLPGVLWAGASFAAAQLYVEFERGRTDLKQIARAAQSHGIRACPIGLPGSADEKTPLAALRENPKLASTLIAAIVAAFGFALKSPWLFATAIALGGWPTARAAWGALRSCSIDMNVLMTVAVIGAAGIGEWAEGVTVVILFNVGALLQAFTIERTRRSIRGLVDLSPRIARVLRGGIEVEVPPASVAIGEAIRIRPGERIPLDGEIVRGASAVNEAPITGESAPVDKSEGDPVFAGALNGTGSIDVRATRRAQDTTLAKILHAVEEAQARRAPSQQLVDKFARYYTPMVVLLAALIALVPPLFGGLWSAWLLRSLSLLIIACPCALVISTPVAIVTAIGAASRRGILIKGGAFIEEMARVRAILYDKTGTLTDGKFSLSDIQSIGHSNDTTTNLLSVAAAVESHSEHPIAMAILQAARERGISIPSADRFESVVGFGARAIVEGRHCLVGSVRLLESEGIQTAEIQTAAEKAEADGFTVVAVAVDGLPLGILTVADQPRESARLVVAELTARGIAHQEMLTGDNARVAHRVSESAGLDGFRAGLLPDGKLEAVASTQRQFGSVAMVGDGINDAPALAAANVGIAMAAAGNDTAIETADISLLGADLRKLGELYAISRATRRIILQNVGFSLVTKAGLLIAAAAAGIPLWLAVVGDVGVSLIVTLNALRLMVVRLPTALPSWQSCRHKTH